MSFIEEEEEGICEYASIPCPFDFHCNDAFSEPVPTIITCTNGVNTLQTINLQQEGVGGLEDYTIFDQLKSINQLPYTSLTEDITVGPQQMEEDIDLGSQLAFVSNVTMSDVEVESDSSVSSDAAEIIISNRPRFRRIITRPSSEMSRANVSSLLDVSQPPASADDSNVEPIHLAVTGNRYNLLPENNERRGDDDETVHCTPSTPTMRNDDKSEVEGNIYSATPSPPTASLRRKEEFRSRVAPRLTRRTSVVESRDGNENFISAASGRLPESDRDNQVRGRSPVVRRRRRRRSRSGTISPDPGLRENVPAPDQRLLSRKRNSIVCAALAAGVQPTPFRLPKNQKPIVPRRPNQSAVPRRELTDADRPFYCRRCGKSFTRKDNYRRHKKEKHTRTPTVYTCDYCGSVFSSKRNQEVHIRSRHLEERQFYYCHRCNMRFINRGTKYAHERVCSGRPHFGEDGVINGSIRGNESTNT